jgi:hypothetical protein
MLKRYIHGAYEKKPVFIILDAMAFKNVPFKRLLVVEDSIQTLLIFTERKQQHYSKIFGSKLL